MKLSDAIRRASELSVVIDDYWLRESPKRHKHYPLIYPGEEPPPPPPEEAELEEFLLSLPLDELHILVGIADIGRLARPARLFAKDQSTIRRVYPDAASSASHLLLETPLHEFLTDGLKQLHDAGVTVDELETVPA